MTAATLLTLSASNNLVTTLYNGNATARSLVTGQDCTNALAFGKRRDLSGDWQVYDTTRGVTKALAFNAIAAQATVAQGLTSFNRNGVSLGTNSLLNASGSSNVIYTIPEKEGVFDKVEYSGTNAAQTLSHSLGSTVGLMIVRAYNDTGTWFVWHKDLPNTSYLVLNSTAAEATSQSDWNSTSPTSTQFTVAANLSLTGDDYIAYLFAHNPAQKIYCGSFTTDGSGNATVTGVGFRVKWLLVKGADVANSWILLDIIRGWGAGGDAVLEPDSSNAEATSTNYGAPTADGFTFSDGSALNSDHIYMAIG